MDDDTLSLLTPRLLGDKPNTYTLTKHLGEVLLVQEGAGLNLTIVRPSIIAAMWKEPYKVEAPFIPQTLEVSQVLRSFSMFHNPQ